MPQQVHEDGYQAGRGHFAMGGTIRQMVEMSKAPHEPKTEEDDDREMGFVIGFADAALDAIRAFLPKA